MGLYPITIELDDPTPEALESIAEVLMAAAEQIRRQDRWVFLLRDRCTLPLRHGDEELN